jgi:hypothetical protein
MERCIDSVNYRLQLQGHDSGYETNPVSRPLSFLPFCRLVLPFLTMLRDEQSRQVITA